VCNRITSEVKEANNKNTNKRQRGRNWEFLLIAVISRDLVISERGSDRSDGKVTGVLEKGDVEVDT
jgi:hypothetical protein